MTDELIKRLTFRWEDFPPLTQTVGSGGVIRSVPEDFRVDEIPLYLPAGHGSHTYVKVQKCGLTTRDLVVALLQEGLSEKEIGVAGLKDKQAITSQWLSVPKRHEAALAALERLPGVTILETSRHKNKLAIGHLKGNRFTIRVRQVVPEGVATAQTTLDTLKQRGIPNYFGPQRFGRGGTNALDGYQLIQGDRVPGGHRLKQFFISALQSLLFNHLLALRIQSDLFDRVILGDWAKKHDTGGVFQVETLAEAERAKRFEISATLPLYGKKVKQSVAQAGELEQQILDRFGLRWIQFAGRHGDRRLSRLPFADATLTQTDDGYTVSFALPKGAFATTVLRELMKVNIDTDNTDASTLARFEQQRTFSQR
jgi:tRNA pseudouridine13 synthase